MFKKIYMVISATLALGAISACSVITPEEFEVLYLHTSRESAEIMANNFNIKLSKYSEYGVTTYTTQSKTQYESLLSTMGFADNGYYEVTEVDPKINEQYALDIVSANQAWTITEGSRDIIIAVIDTGIDLDHPELIHSLYGVGYNSRTEQEGLEYVEDDRGHGTSTIGVIAAAKDNGIGIAGIAPGVSILPIKANTETTTAFRDADVINGILYAIDQDVDIINISIGNGTYNSLMEQAVDLAVEAGILVVAAAGNTGRDQYVYPAAHASVVSVSSISDTRGSSFFTTYNDQVDISAPGHNIVSTSFDGGYNTVSGTSFASPYVAGIAALIKSVYPDITVDELKARLYDNAVDEGEPGWDKYFGHGIVNAYNSLTTGMPTVSFNTYGGSDVDPIRIVPGETLPTIDDPTKQHYTFDGWYTSSTYSTEWDMANIIESNIILHAKWTPVTYTVSYYNDSFISSESVVYGDLLVNQPTVEKQGHDFAGWYLNDVLYDNTSSPTSDIQLYARWTTRSYSIIYLDHNGDVHAEYTYAYGSVIDHEEPIGPNKEYYDFSGWTGTLPATMPDRNIVITPAYAKRIGVVYVTLIITVVYDDGSENVITIEVPQDEVDDIIAEYGNGTVIS
jgi:uncharacterized repeat protein (TIGR02543 family)